MDDDRSRRDDLDDAEEDDGTLGIWAAFDRDAEESTPAENEVNVDTLKERLKHAARLRASRPREEFG